MSIRPVTLIAGPTASGKSALALQKAGVNDAMIINADSMQVYGVLRVLTARPSDADLKLATHKLYGHISPAISYSTGQWLRDVSTILKNDDKRPVIFVGGTGLYFRALLGGLSEIPETPEHIRQKWRDALNEEGAANLHHILFMQDKELATRIHMQDGQRIIRALEVIEATGKTLSWWQEQKSIPLIDGEKADKLVILPDREKLYDSINRRFSKMVELGAMEEVKQLDDMQLDVSLPAMKAIGVPELLQVLKQNNDLSWALEQAQMQTRRYAKRQYTWFKNQLDPSWIGI